MARVGDQIDWLFDYEGAVRVMPSGDATSIDDQNWRATFAHIELGPGMRVVLTSAEVHRDIDVEPRREEPDLWISGSIAVRGSVNIALPDGSSTDLDSERCALISLSGKRVRYRAAAPQKLMIAGYVIREDRLLRMFDGDPPLPIRQLVDPRQSVPIVPLPATFEVRRLAAGLFSTELTGALRRLYLEGAVGQLLAVQSMARAEHEVSTRPVPQGRHRQAIEEARHLLLADMRDPPSLAELARSVGIREKQLTAGFRALYGVTAFELLRNERLEHARLAMEAGLALKVVAERVGYGHVANFIAAFTQRYGAPPGRYRRLHGQSRDD